MINQWLSKKWKPYDEPAEYIIKDRELKISNTKTDGHLKAIVFFVIGVIFTACLTTFLNYF